MSHDKPVWLDANVILRYLLDTGGDHLERATALLKRAEQGEVKLMLTPIIVAECVWVLKSFYKLPLELVAQTLLRVIELEGLHVEGYEHVKQALGLMAEKNVDFTDAYLLALSQGSGGSVASFDQDFRRLGAELLDF